MDIFVWLRRTYLKISFYLAVNKCESMMKGED